jgi:predicted Zn-dependent protease
LASLVLLAGLAQAAKEIKPGWNLFTPAQDVEMGQQAAAEIEKEVPIVDDRELTNYVARIGKKLSDASPAPDYPYTFKVVAEPSINAFALPGGPIYVHTGLISAADNEAQVAGVLAHEVAHVALRHSTNQVSKQYAFQIPVALAASALGNKGGILSMVSQLGISFGLNSVFMKYSRDAEKDADLIGTRIMSSVGYDPVQMARFFEKLEAESGGSGGSQFFSDHPNPGNRVNYVQEEIKGLPKRNYTTGDQREFNSMKSRVAKIKIPEKPSENQQQTTTTQPPANTAPPVISGQTTTFNGHQYRLNYPQEWKAYDSNQGMAVTIVPQNGVVNDARGNPAMARGAMAGYFSPKSRDLKTATDELIADFQKSNADLRELRGQRTASSLDRQRAESLLLVGSSPLGNQREYVWLMTSIRGENLFYVLQVAPEPEFNQLRPHFEAVARSVRFR